MKGAALLSPHLGGSLPWTAGRRCLLRTRLRIQRGWRAACWHGRHGGISAGATARRPLVASQQPQYGFPLPRLRMRRARHQYFMCKSAPREPLTPPHLAQMPRENAKRRTARRSSSRQWRYIPRCAEKAFLPYSTWLPQRTTWKPCALQWRQQSRKFPGRMRSLSLLAQLRLTARRRISPRRRRRTTCRRTSESAQKNAQLGLRFGSVISGAAAAADAEAPPAAALPSV